MNANRKLDIRIAQFLLVRNNIPLIIGGTLAAAFVWFIFLPDHVPFKHLLSWFLFVICLSIVRAITLRHWHLYETTRENVNNRVLLATLLAFTSSCAFGLFGYYSLSETEQFSNLLVVIIISAASLFGVRDSSFTAHSRKIMGI